jgi:hypothetical protein
MKILAQSRCHHLTEALAVLALLCASAYLNAQPPQALKPAAPSRNGGNSRSAIGPHQNQEHLAQWMERHRDLPLDKQHSALQNEPGFRQLPPQTQQRYLERLTQLNNMPEVKRRRILERNEALEHLTQPPRQQVVSAMHQLSGLPVDRRRLVSRAFRDLREMPDPQRQAILNSDRIRGQFSDQERSTLTHLLAVEPYLPVQHGSDPVNAGK